MFKKSKLFFWTIEILAVALLIYLLTQIQFVFQPIKTLLALLFIPFIIAGFLYYIFNPVVIFMEKKLKIKKTLGIFIVLLVILGLIIFAMASVIPSLISQLTDLINATAKAYPEVRHWIESLQHDPRFAELYKQIELLENMNHTISRYISGVALDALLVFVVVFIGYLILGIPYAFLFALFAGVTNLIPYAGPYIGVLPMVVTVAFNHPITALIAVIYVLVLQQLDGNLVYPKIVGSAVKVHPVTVMILMLISGSLYGILGMIIAVPAYCLVKEIVKFLNGLYRNHKAQQKKIISK